MRRATLYFMNLLLLSTAFIPKAVYGLEEGYIQVELTPEEYAEEQRLVNIVGSNKKDENGDWLFMQIDYKTLPPIWRAEVARKQIWWCSYQGYWDKYKEIEDFFMNLEPEQRSEYDVAVLERIAMVHNYSFNPPAELGITDEQKKRAWYESNIKSQYPGKEMMVRRHISANYPATYYQTFLKGETYLKGVNEIAPTDEENNSLAYWERRFDELEQLKQQIYALPELGDYRVGLRKSAEFVLQQGIKRYDSRQERIVANIRRLVQSESGKELFEQGILSPYVDDPLMPGYQQTIREAYREKCESYFVRRPELKPIFEKLDRSEYRLMKERYEDQIKILTTELQKPNPSEYNRQLKENIEAELIEVEKELQRYQQ